MKKKMLFSVLLFVLLSGIFSVSSFAAEKKGEVGNGLAQEYVEEFSDIIPAESGITIDEEELVKSVGFEALFGAIYDAVCGNGSEFVSFFLSVFGFAVLSVVAELSSFSSENVARGVGVAVFVVMSVFVYPRLYSLFSTVAESLRAVTLFFGSAAPLMTAITAASGAVSSAGIQGMNMNIALGIVGSVAVNLLLPLSFSLLALAMVSSFSESAPMAAIKGIKSVFTFGLGLITAISSAAIALQSVIASAADSAAQRAARYAAGTLIPVVGSTVSSAIATLSGGLAYAKSTVGAGAICVIVILALTPLVSLVLYRTVFSVSIFFLEYLDNTRASRCFSAYRFAIDTVIAVYVMSTMVCIIQIIVFLKGGISGI